MPLGRGSNEVPAISIIITDQLPASVPCIADIGDGTVKMLILAGLSQLQTVRAIGDIWAKVIEVRTPPTPRTPSSAE